MRVDHVSLDGSIEALRDLGFAVTATVGGGHARVHLGGVYVEVSDVEDGSHDFVGKAWYLRPDDTSGCVEQLRQRGLAVSDASPYHGRDGEWLDARILAPALGAGVPGPDSTRQPGRRIMAATATRATPQPRAWLARGARGDR